MPLLLPNRGTVPIALRNPRSAGTVDRVRREAHLYIETVAAQSVWFLMLETFARVVIGVDENLDEAFARSNVSRRRLPLWIFSRVKCCTTTPMESRIGIVMNDQESLRKVSLLNRYVQSLCGLYSRVARQLNVDRSYVSRVARGERRSEQIEQALSSEFTRIMNENETQAMQE